MKRSHIDSLINKTLETLEKHQFVLPKFAYWTHSDWTNKNVAQCQEIIDLELGWDVTDLGTNSADSSLVLFTIRNGSVEGNSYPKPYAEKIIMLNEGVVVPLHFHRHKMEDIINRGKDKLLLKLYNSTTDEDLDKKSKIHYSIDGCHHESDAGVIVSLDPGESITLTPLLYHSFWTDKGPLLVGEVSMVNNDHTDNRFHESIARFSTIEEDTQAQWVLSNEYNIIIKRG